jgi:YVTN family beta-propeller protein
MGNASYIGRVGALSVIRTSTNTVIATIPVGFLPSEVAISPDGTRAYVINGGSDTVSVIQL